MNPYIHSLTFVGTVSVPILQMRKLRQTLLSFVRWAWAKLTPLEPKPSVSSKASSSRGGSQPCQEGTGRGVLFTQTPLQGETVQPTEVGEQAVLLSEPPALPPAGRPGRRWAHGLCVAPSPPQRLNQRNMTAPPSLPHLLRVRAVPRGLPA